ncbi:charged multivesicular body protein 7 isoform X1 [Abrus precatorius]|uniref:Charged multivesicular body protein 7 isoform X1 n=1 Tax=Abrus precatorius TaxID=3816 RepID=A0A8B8L684_ABRPR|nr:charged multivesicular body protein 7 isoform X1 [Abrus precatorius]
MDSVNARVRDFIAKEVPNWNDEMVAVARFKAFSGQRCDWQPNFLFWRHLIIKIATHFGLLLIRPSQVKNDWFNRGGLTPLCLDQVMSLMYNEGDITRTVDLMDPTSGRFSQLVRKVSNLITRSATPDIMAEECIIVTSLLKDKAAEVVKHLSESHWNSSCIITMKKFQDICGGSDEASVILRYMSGCKTTQYLSVHKKEFVEGVKISLSAGALSGISDLDCDILYLIWTTEKLQQQLNVTDRRYESSRKSALASLRSGNKKLALKFAREMKLVTQSREKCSSLLSRVEEVLGIIADAESTKKVSEAMQIGARAIKENKISVEDVDLCLRDIQESIDSQKEVEKSLEQTPSYTDIEDEDIEEEFKELELAVGTEAQVPAPEKTISSAEGRTALEAAECISDALSSLKLSDGPAGKPGVNRVVSEGDKITKNLEMEAA